MAEIGDTQQRLRTQNELKKETFSIERDILKLKKEQASVDEKHNTIESALRASMKKKLAELQQFAEERLAIEKEIALLTERHDQAVGDAKLGVKALIENQERLMRDAIALEGIQKLQLQDIEEEITLQKQLADQEEARLNGFIGFLGKFGELFKVQKKYSDGLLKMYPKLAAGIRIGFAAALTLIELSIKAFLQFDDSLAKFRIHMGMMRTDAFRISTAMKQVAVEMAHVGVTIEGVVDATIALADEFGGTAKVSKDLVETTSILKAQLGVAEQSSAGFLRNISALGKSTAQAQQHMAYVAQALSSAAGVPLNMVMQDVAKMSGNALAMVSKMPMAIVKSAVAARQMGTTLNKMADASANILNFTESVQAEMEASVLVGEQVNLQLARELAYRGKIVESTKAIMSEAKRINFEKLDYFQMQAFATASGRSVDELMKMIQAQKQLQAARGIDGLKDEVAEYERLTALSEADLKNEGKQAEIAVKRLANQARMAALQQQFNQLILEASVILFPIVDKTLQFAGFIMQATRGVFAWLFPFKMIGETLTTIVVGFGKIFGFIPRILKPLATFGSWLSESASFVLGLGGGIAKIGGAIAGWLGPFAKFLVPFAKFLGPIGWVITAFQLISSIWKNFDLKAPFFGLDKVIKEVLFDPFIKAWDWISGIFVGHSPSKLALGIVQGIIGVEAMIFDALTSPFRRFLAWVADKIPGMGGVAEKLRKGMTGNLEDIGVLEKKAAKPETKPISVTTEGTPLPATTVQTVSSPEEQKRKDQDSTTLTNILAALGQLNANLQSGKIGVYIDGQLMSATLARQTAFKGGYGMNMA